MRTPGALNKPKYILVSLKDLNKVFNSETVIKISSEYKPFLEMNVSLNEFGGNNQERISNKIQIVEID